MQITKEVVSKVTKSVAKKKLAEISAYSLIVGMTATQLGYWGAKGVGAVSDPTIARLSITRSNNIMFLDSDPRETRSIIDVHIGGYVTRLFLSSGRFTGVTDLALVSWLENQVGNTVDLHFTLL